MENLENELLISGKELKADENKDMTSNNYENNNKINEDQENSELFKIKEMIRSHFFVMKNYLSSNKEKDININKLSSMLQTYRSGFEFNMFKSIALNIISLREDLRKSYREFETRDLSSEIVEKYLNYIVLDYEDLFSNLGIEFIENKWFFNKKDLNEELTGKIEFAEIDLNKAEDLQEITIETVDDVIYYIKVVEDKIIDILKENSERDKILNTYIQHSELYEAGIYQVVLYPVIRKIISAYEKIKLVVDNKISELTIENCKNIYLDVLKISIDYLDNILILCNVTIDSFVSETFDGKKQRILKIVSIDDESKNAVIAKRYTDCYTMEEKIIYPQKVDVYKINK